MRFAIPVLILTAFLAATPAERKPQLTWEGVVSEGTDLFIHGRSVDVQGRTTGAVDSPKVRFSSPLPAAALRVDMEVRRGRGKVVIVEQPAPENDFSLIVRIDARGQQPELYSIRFFWDAQAAVRNATRPAARPADLAK